MLLAWWVGHKWRADLKLTHHIITQLLYLNVGMARSERDMLVKGHTFSLTACGCHSRTRQAAIVVGIAACIQPHTCTATVGDHGPPCQNDWVAIGRHINMHVLCFSLRLKTITHGVWWPPHVHSAGMWPSVVGLWHVCFCTSANTHTYTHTHTHTHTGLAEQFGLDEMKGWQREVEMMERAASHINRIHPSFVIVCTCFPTSHCSVHVQHARTCRSVVVP
jgi:hypothetical protein